MSYKPKFLNNSLVFHPFHGLGTIKSNCGNKTRSVEFKNNSTLLTLKETELKNIPYCENSIFYYDNVLYEVKEVFVERNQVKYKIHAFGKINTTERIIDICDYKITHIDKNLQGKMRKMAFFMQRYNQVVKNLNRKSHLSTDPFSEITISILDATLEKCHLNIRSIENLPMALKKIKSTTLQLANLTKNPFEFIRPDLQIISYKKAAEICELLKLNIPFSIKLEKWSYDLMHSKNTFYYEARDFYTKFSEFCKSHQCNRDIYLEELNTYVIHKVIDGKQYKTTEFLLNVEKQMTDMMMELFYDKKYNIPQVKILELVSQFETIKRFTLSEEQKTAVVSSITNKFYIINGFPGTGKSTIVECILYVFKELDKAFGVKHRIATNLQTLQQQGADLDFLRFLHTETSDQDIMLNIKDTHEIEGSDEDEDDVDCNTDTDNASQNDSVYMKKCKYPESKNIAILAPTGLAYIGLQNKCMPETFNKVISGTCHRVSFIQFPKIKDILKKLSTDVEIEKELTGIRPEALILDEFSMIDSFILKDILDWCKYFKCRLIILGDENQLPSIGPGCNLKNLIECALFPQSKLTEIKRQEDGVLLNNIKKMTYEKITRDDFTDASMSLIDIDHFIEVNEDMPIEIQRESLQKMINQEKLNFHNTKFISYFQKETYLFNVTQLNILLQSMFNLRGEIIHSPNKYKEKFQFKVGDVIIRTENDYSVGEIRANGEQSIIKSYSAGNDMVILYVMEEKKDYKVNVQTLYDDFMLGYALTIHKAQGSQYDNVVIFIDKNQRIWHKTALYTAISRAKNRCIIISKESDFESIQDSKRSVTDKISLFMKESDNYEFEE